MMKYNRVEIIIKFLGRQGIEIKADILGRAKLFICNAMYKISIRHVLIRHEHEADFIVYGMARSIEKPLQI